MRENLGLRELLILMREEALGKTIYVVEDEEMIRKCVTRLLSKRGYKYIECCDGIDFRESLEKHGDIGFVITDLMMPHENGVKVLEYLKKCGIPALVITACDRGEDIVNEVRVLQVPIIWKPLSNSDLMNMVEELFGEP